MTEIELKAHVADPVETERIIRTFAEFRKETEKSDTYWKQGSTPDDSESVADAIPAYGKVPVFAAISIAFTFIAALAAAVAVTAGAGKFVIIGICAGAALADLVVGIVTLGGKNTAAANRSPPVTIRIRIEDGETAVTYKRKEIQGNIEVNDEREFTISDPEPFKILLTDLGFSPYTGKHKKTKSFSWKADGGTEVTIELSLVGGLGWFVEIEILADSPDEVETQQARATLMETLAQCGLSESAIESRYYTEMLAEPLECQGPKK